jgi:hypothetical protein
MKMTRVAFILMVAVAMIMGIAQATLAGRSGTEAPGTELPIATDPSAHGMKLSGVLGTHYEKLSGQTCTSEVGPNVSMTFFMRLESGKNLYPFGSAALDVCYWDFDAQWTAIQGLVRTQVIPFLKNQGVIDISNACFAFKEVSDAVDSIGDNLNDPLKPAFSLLNFVLAIDDRTECLPTP